MCTKLYAPMEWEVSNLKRTIITRTLMNDVLRQLKAPIALSLIVLVHQYGPGSYEWPVLSQ